MSFISASKLFHSHIISRSYGEQLKIIATPGQIQLKIKYVLFSVLAWQSCFAALWGPRSCPVTGTKLELFVLKIAERSSDEKLLTNSKNATRVYNDKKN